MPLLQVWSHIKDRTILVCLALAMLVLAYARNHNNMAGMVWADTEGYYMYLPAVLYSIACTMCQSAVCI